MILLENKINYFNKMVYLKKKEECEDRIKKEEEHSASEIENKKIELEKDLNQKVSARKKLAEKQGYELISKINEEKRILELRKNEQLLEKLIEDLKIKFLDFRKSNEYKKYVRENFSKILDELDEDEVYIRIRDVLDIKKDLEEVANEKGVKINFKTLEEKYIGGFIISDVANSYNIDLTLAKKIEQQRYNIGRILHFELKEGEDR